MTGKSNKFAAVKKYFFPALSFIVPVFFTCLYFAIRNITPFGDNTILSHDMDAQYIDFYVYLKDAISGNRSFSWTLSRGLGSDIRLFSLYYFFSPFNLLFTLFPESQLPAAVSIILVLISGLSGLSFFCCLNYLHSSLKPYSDVFYSIAYSMSGWMLMNSQNFQFTQAAVWLPAVYVIAEKTIDGGKKLFLSAALFFVMLFNFYTGAMIWIFVFLLMAFDKRIPFIETIKAFGFSVLISLPVLWFPVRHILLSGESVGVSFHRFLNFDPFLLIRQTFPGYFSLDQMMDNGMPQIYCGIITILSMLYYFAFQHSDDKRASRFFVLLVLLASLVISPLTQIWHGLQKPHWYPYRFTFLLVFLIAVCASDANIILSKWIYAVGIIPLVLNLFAVYDVIFDGAVTLSDYKAYDIEKKELISQITEKNELVSYRIEDIYPRSDNDAMHYGYAGISGFDSLLDLGTMDFLKKSGFTVNRNTVRYGLGNTTFINYFLGVRYVLEKNEIKSAAIPAGFAFFTNRDVIKGLPEAENCAAFQNMLAQSIGLKEKFLYEIDPGMIEYDNSECENSFCSIIDPDRSAKIKFLFNIEDQGKIYIHKNYEANMHSLDFSFDNSNICVECTDYFIPAAEIKNNGEFVITLETELTSFAYPDVDFFFENTEIVEQFFSAAYKGITSHAGRDGNIEISVAPAPYERNILITIPFGRHPNANVSGPSQALGIFHQIAIPPQTEKIFLYN